MRTNDPNFEAGYSLFTAVGQPVIKHTIKKAILQGNAWMVKHFDKVFFLQRTWNKTSVHWVPK